MSFINYFAFGSNLTPARLFARTGVCDIVGVAKVRGHRMAFRKRGADDSAKCDIFATESDHIAEGVVFALPATSRPVLDRFEGVGNGYEVVTLEAEIGTTPIEVIAYQAQPPWIEDDLLPLCWYRDFVLEGGKRFGLSSEWIATVTEQAYVDDPDRSRAEKNNRILRLTDAEADAMAARGDST